MPTRPLPFRERMAAAYLSGLGAACLYGLSAANDAAAPVLIGITADLRATCQVFEAMNIWPMRVEVAWWFFDRDAAEAVCGYVRAVLFDLELHVRGDWYAAEPEVIRQMFGVRAQVLGARYLSDEQMMQDIDAHIDQVEARLKAMQADGELKEVNQDYRNYRMITVGAGGKPLPYALWLHDYKVHLIKMIGENLRIADAKSAKNV
jgi:hypothetical protein